MSGQIIASVYFIISIALSIFIIYRLGIGKNRQAGGGGFIYAGLILIVISSGVNLLQQLPGYSQWFLPGFYPYIIFIKFILLAAGFILLAAGLSLVLQLLGRKGSGGLQ